MITWEEYKKYKKSAERYLEDGVSNNVEIQIELYSFHAKAQTKEVTMERLINILSNDRHFENNPFYEKIK